MNYTFDYINRWRHTRGYGVHSPLAYRIVKDCIRPDVKYGFYSDAYLDFEYRDDRNGLKNSKMIIRLVNLFSPKRIWVPGCDKRISTALKMSFPKIQLVTQKDYPKNVDFIICSNGDCQAMWNKMSALPECVMVAFGKELDVPEGATLMICNKRFSIVIRRIGMGFVSYDV